MTRRLKAVIVLAGLGWLAYRLLGAANNRPVRRGSPFGHPAGQALLCDVD